MKIRVLHLITDLEVGGAPLFIRHLTCGFDRRRFEIQVACLAPEGPLVRELRGNSIPTHCLGAKGPWDIRVFYRLARLIAVFQPHILHCTLVHANIVGRIVGRLCGVPHIVATIQTAEHGKNWHLTAENLSCRLSDITVCVSRSVSRHTRQFSHVPDNRLRVITNAVDCERFAGAQPIDPTQAKIPTGKINIIFVGRLDPVKNIDILLKSLAELALKYDVLLHIIGDGPMRESLVRQAGDLALTDRVRFMGTRRDVERWLKFADIFVLPSRWEGLSLSALEAMAAGIPVVASRTAGLVDIIEDGKTGLLVQPGNVWELSNAIEKLITAPEYARQLGRAAQEHVRQNFSLSAIIDAHARLYKELFVG